MPRCAGPSASAQPVTLFSFGPRSSSLALAGLFATKRPAVVPAIYADDKHVSLRHDLAQDYFTLNFPCIARSTHYLFEMATKAERFRAEQQIASSQPKPKRPKAQKPAPEVNAATPGVSGAGKAQRNFKKRPKDGAALEVSSEISKASRKSTRSSAGHIKQATQLTRRQKGATHSPKERAVRAAARA
jgi:hypothetical protein